MKREMRKELVIGLLLFACYQTLHQFVTIPELLSGVILGFVIVFELIGAMPDTAYLKLKAWKKKWLFSKIQG